MGDSFVAEMNHLYRELMLPAVPAEEMVYVLGHINPDSDAAGAAIGCAMLLQGLGLQARAALPGPVNAETRFACASLGLEEPAVIDSVAHLPVVLVDHSSCSQAVLDLDEARLIGVIDHHGIGDVNTSEPVFIRSARTGAASTLVWLCWVESGIPIPQAAASALLMGILSDTRNLTMNVTQADRQAVRALMDTLGMQDRARQELYTGMRKALIDYEGMSDADIFHLDYKEYEAGEIRFGVGVVRASGAPACRKVAKRMRRYMEEAIHSLDVDMLFLMVSNIAADGMEMILTAVGKGADEALTLSFGPEADGMIELAENLSRKSTFVPKLRAVLEHFPEIR